MALNFKKTIKVNDKEYTLVANINVVEKIQKEFGSVTVWCQKIFSEEIDAHAAKFGALCLINEAIDIKNENEHANIKHITDREVGILLTEYGIGKFVDVIIDAVIPDNEENEKNM